MQAQTPEVSAEKATTPDELRLVSVEQLKKIHRDLDACQKVIWLAGCRPRGYGFDPSYVTDAQERLKEIEALLAESAPQALKMPAQVTAAMWRAAHVSMETDGDLALALQEALNAAPIAHTAHPDAALREQIRSMTAMLENREWANLLSTDEDIARLDSAITALVGERSAARAAPQGQSGWISVGDRLPDPEQHDRVLIFTDGYDFAGEQYFDVKAECLNENSFGDPDDQPEPYSRATHWMPLPLPTLSAPQPEQSGLVEVLREAERFIAGFEGCELQEGIDELLMRIRAAQSELGGSHA